MIARPSRWLWLGLLVSLLPALASSQTGPTLPVEVVRVADGDTIVVCCIGWRQESVRYIGIDTPETSHPTKGVEAYGREAKEANSKLVAGKKVRLNARRVEQANVTRGIA